jgi:hypothetical protein
MELRHPLGIEHFFECHQVIIREPAEVIEGNGQIVQKQMAVVVHLDLDPIITHVFKILHQEWHQMLWQKQLSKIVRLCEIIFIIVLNFLFHVILQALRESNVDFFKNEIDLHEVSSWSSLVRSTIVVTIDIIKIGVEASYNFWLGDNVLINFILEFL